MTRRRNPSTSVKQILVRDYNWRMGNLRRIYHSLWGVSPATKEAIQSLIWDEQVAQKVLHERRLEVWEAYNIRQEEPAEDDPMREDNLLWAAITQAEYNKRQKAQ